MDFRFQKPSDKNLNTLLVSVSENNQQIWPADCWYGCFEDMPYLIDPKTDTIIID